MSELGRYIRDARAADGVTRPIIASPEEAVRVIRAAGAEIPGLSPAERLVMLSDLKELSNLLAAHIARLDLEMVEIKQKLHQARSSRLACSSYVQSAASAYSTRRH
jgi:hypothetical protein